MIDDSLGKAVGRYQVAAADCAVPKYAEEVRSLRKIR